MSVKVINRFGRDVTLIRSAGSPVLVDGYYQPIAPASNYHIRAAVQPLSDQEIQMLPEGSLNTESFKIYTIEKLYAREGDPVTRADLIEIGCERYEVLSVTDYTLHEAMGLTYYRSVIQKVGYDA